MGHSMTMTRNTLLYLVACILVAPPARAQSVGSPLCKAGASVVELMLFSSPGQFVQSELRTSIIFLAECPSSVIPAFKEVSEDESSEQASGLRQAWIDAVRSASRDPSDSDLRAFLAVAEAKVTRIGDHSLTDYLTGIFDGLPNRRSVAQRPMGPLFDRQALAVLRGYAECGAAACYKASDNILFLLGNHPISMLKAMHADSVDARNWLSSVADDSFSGIAQLRNTREAIRRAVLKKLSLTRADGFERERRACEDALRSIRYRTVE